MSEQRALRVQVGEAKRWDMQRCALCGESWDSPVALALYDDDEPHAELKFIGFMCFDCDRAGADGARARARVHAQRLREMADRIERLAERLPDDAQWPSDDEIERFGLELDAERRAGVLVEQDVPF